MFDWSSSDPVVGTVNEDGLFTTLAPGVITVIASSGGVEGSSAVTALILTPTTEPTSWWSGEDAGGTGWIPPTTIDTANTTPITPGATITQPISMLVPAGLSMDATTRVITVNLSAAGSYARISGPMMIVTGEQADLIIATAGVSTASTGNASGVVRTIAVEGHPLRLDGAIGHMVASYRAALETLPVTDAQIGATFSENPDQYQEVSFGQAVAAENSVIDGIAGVISVRTANIQSKGTATIWMSAPSAWVNEHGGTSSIRILRIGDTGEIEVLNTTFSGYGEEGTMVFEGQSPHGFSTFGLAALVPAEPGRTPVVLSAPQIVKTAAPVAGAASAPSGGSGESSLLLGFAVTAMSGVLLISSVILGIYLVRFGRVLLPKR